jgi:hypothetical protein
LQNSTESFDSNADPDTGSEYNEIDWNEQFQHFVDMEDCQEKFENIRDLASDFAYCAQTYAVFISTTRQCTAPSLTLHIISELCLPDDEKIIKPVSIGGVICQR